MHTALSLKDVEKFFQSASHRVEVLRGVSFELAPGDTAAVLGPSGSGKTTLLSLCAGLEAPSAGTVRLLDRDLGVLDEDQRAALRNRQVGFVFQSFHLMPSLTALENVMLPMELSGAPGARDEAQRLLAMVGLENRGDHYPAQLSGGEQQRVAIARAFINQPRVLFADEPTGNLDRKTAGRVTDLLFELNREQGATLLLITHDESLAARAKRVFRIDNGLVREEAS